MILSIRFAVLFFSLSLEAAPMKCPGSVGEELWLLILGGTSMAQQVHTGEGPPQLVGIETFEPTETGHTAMDIVMEKTGNAIPAEVAPSTPSKRKSTRVAAQPKPTADKPKAKRGRKPKQAEESKPAEVVEPMKVQGEPRSYKFTPERAQFYEERLKAEIWALRHFGPEILQNLSEEVPHHPVTHVHHKTAVGKLGGLEHIDQHNAAEVSYVVKEVGSEPVKYTFQATGATPSQ